MTDEQNYSHEINSDLSSEFLVFNSQHKALNVQQLKRILEDPIKYNQEARAYSRSLYNKSGIYSNVIDYMGALPTLDKVIYGENRHHDRFKENREKFGKVLDMIDHDAFIRDGIHKGGIDGTAFWYFETKGQSIRRRGKYLSDRDVDESEINQKFNATIIPLPTDYCKIVGRVNATYEVAFDLSYFNQFTGKGRSKKLRRYPQEIRRAFKNYRTVGEDSKWVILDPNKTITLKVRAKLDERWGRPLGLSALLDMMYDEYQVDTKRNILDDVNTNIVYQEFPEGERKGSSSLTKQQQQQQHNNIKSALFKSSNIKGVNFFSVASGTKLNQMKTDIEFLKTKGEEELIRRITTNLGFASSLLNAENGSLASQKSNLELISAEIFSWIKQLQQELNKVINANIIQDEENFIRVYYLPITHVNRKETVGYYKDLYMNASGSRIAYIAATGIDPEPYLALMDYEQEEDFDKRYPPHLTSYTTSGDSSDNEGGRELDNDSENENTLKNKGNGSNPID